MFAAVKVPIWNYSFAGPAGAQSQLNSITFGVELLVASSVFLQLDVIGLERNTKRNPSIGYTSFLSPSASLLLMLVLNNSPALRAACKNNDAKILPCVNIKLFLLF